MNREIDILTGLDHGRCLVVEKATNEVWTPDELLEEATAGDHFRQADRLTNADDEIAVSGPYPGCMQLAGAGEENFHYRVLGQTKHFLVFERPR